MVIVIAEYWYLEVQHIGTRVLLGFLKSDRYMASTSQKKSLHTESIIIQQRYEIIISL